MRVCRYCKGEFEPKCSTQFFCSPKCRAAIRGGNWKSQRAAALKRDSEECQECHTSGQLDVHHILPLYLGGTHALDNLISLCRTHHKEKHRRWVTHAEEVITPTVEVGRSGGALLPHRGGAGLWAAAL